MPQRVRPAQPLTRRQALWALEGVNLGIHPRDIVPLRHALEDQNFAVSRFNAITYLDPIAYPMKPPEGTPFVAPPPLEDDLE